MKNITALVLCPLFLFIACKDDNIKNEISSSTFTLSSIAVEAGELFDEYKCEEKVDGIENSIPLTWENVPEEANSLAIVMHHYPNASDATEVNSYLLLWDIETSILEIPYGMADDGDWYMGANKDGNAVSYTSPCSQGTGTHEYIITLYALSEVPPDLPEESSIEVDYDTMINALSEVTIIDTAILTFNDVN